MPYRRVDQGIEDGLPAPGEITEGHYTLHADAFDAEQVPASPKTLLDPIQAAQREAAQVAAEINTMPSEQRSSALAAKAERLHNWANFLASTTNVGLVLRRSSEQST